MSADIVDDMLAAMDEEPNHRMLSGMAREFELLALYARQRRYCIMAKEPGRVAIAAARLAELRTELRKLKG